MALVVVYKVFACTNLGKYIYRSLYMLHRSLGSREIIFKFSEKTLQQQPLIVITVPMSFYHKISLQKRTPDIMTGPISDNSNVHNYMLRLHIKKQFIKCIVYYKSHIKIISESKRYMEQTVYFYPISIYISRYYLTH